jgi:hypothetical protein
LVTAEGETPNWSAATAKLRALATDANISIAFKVSMG